jgi:hypothetical protein
MGVGESVGDGVTGSMGASVGRRVGNPVGVCVGDWVGTCVGDEVGGTIIVISYVSSPAHDNPLGLSAETYASKMNMLSLHISTLIDSVTLAVFPACTSVLSRRFVTSTESPLKERLNSVTVIVFRPLFETM